jgi:hypothetical protein
MEAITDPDVSTGWYDSSDENGDEYAYVYGETKGSGGRSTTRRSPGTTT